MEEPATFGARLRRYREAAGLSQEDLAERAGLTAGAIGALERGERRRPYPHTVQLLATALDLDDAQRATLIAAVPRRERVNPQDSEATPPRAGSTSTAPVEYSPMADGYTPAAPFLPADPGRTTTALVGRQHELALLQAKMADAMAGHGGVAMLVGEAGIGKTRLARELAGDAESRGAAVLWGRCFEGDWQPPYGPWVEALGACLRARGVEGVQRDLGAGGSPVARLVPEIRAALPDLPVPSPLSPDEERFRLYDAITRFLFAVATHQPLLLVLDDLHWADADSLRLLRHVARFAGRARMLVVGAYRDPEFGLNDEHPLMGTLAELRREDEYERIAMRGFSRHEVGEFLAQTSGDTLPPALVSLIRDETCGNPFYVREVFRHLTEEAKLLRRNGRWSTDFSRQELGIPEGVRQVVGRRVSRLSAQTGTLLRLAAGFTGGFGFDVLQALSELPEQALLDCIDEALQAGLIRTSSQVPPRYEFAHAIVRHTLYEGLNLDRRARLHRRIALALEQTQPGGGATEAAELAAQYHASSALPGAAKGVTYALRAAEQAKAAYAQERAAGFLRFARDLSATSAAAERAEILRQLAIAEAEAVRLEEARRSVEDALEAMSAAGVEPRARAELLVAVVRALKDAGADAALWEPLVERGLAFVGDRRDLLWARLALLRDRCQSIQSGPIGGSQWLGHDPQAVAVARAEGDEEDYARTLDSLDFRSRDETNAVLALARSWSRPLAIMRALEVAGRDLLYLHSAFDEARAVYEELLAVSERFGSIPYQAEALTHIATIQMETGDLALGQQGVRRAEEVIAQLGTSHRTHEFVAITRAIYLAYFLGGDWARLAADAVAYATSSTAKRGSVGVVAAIVAVLALNRAGKAVEARALFEHVAAVVARLSPTVYAYGVAVACAGVAIWDLGATEYAAAYRRSALDQIEAGVGYAGFGPLELLVARMSTLAGDFENAQEYFERARNQVEALRQTHIRGIVDYECACALMRSGTTDRARIGSLLDVAMDAFRRHGMLDWAMLAREQKEALGHEA